MPAARSIDTSSTEPPGRARSARPLTDAQRGNSFDALRILFALLVIIAHSYALVRLPDPLQQVTSMAYDLGRHLVWKLLRIRGLDDMAQWIWLAGWCGGLLSARRTLERARE